MPSRRDAPSGEGGGTWSALPCEAQSSAKQILILRGRQDVSTDGERGETCYGPKLTALPKAKMFKISPLNP